MERKRKGRRYKETQRKIYKVGSKNERKRDGKIMERDGKKRERERKKHLSLSSADVYCLSL